MIKIRNQMTAQLSCALSASSVPTFLYQHTYGREAGFVADIHHLPA